MVEQSFLMPTYAPLPVSFQRGRGAWLYDNDGNAVLDGTAGIAVCSLGHAHPELGAVIADQAKRLLHTSNLYRIEFAEQLAERLCRLCGMDKAFLCNSGTEANEVAIKMALLEARRRKLSSPRVIVCENAFHGRTMGSLSATGSDAFAPLLPCFVRVPYDDVGALQAFAGDSSVVAVMLEPIQGDGGVNVPGQGYLGAVRELCDSNGWLLLLDEVQCGMCRSGRWFAFEHENVLPDVFSVAKALGNGFPIGACLARGKAAELMQPGTHGSTYGGNPLAARVALAVIDIMERDQIALRAESHGRELLSQLRQELGTLPGVKSIRGKGMMLGLELESADPGLVVRRGLEQGVLLSRVRNNVVRLLPPLIVNDEERGLLAERTAAAVRSVLAA